jgi:hypothetical protein
MSSDESEASASIASTYAAFATARFSDSKHRNACFIVLLNVCFCRLWHSSSTTQSKLENVSSFMPRPLSASTKSMLFSASASSRSS